MANPYVNKVILSDGTVLIDLSGDSISAADAIVGVSLHLATGEVVSGTLNDFTGATASADGTHGLVPQPDAGEQNKVLFGDGHWRTLTIERYVEPTPTTKTRILRLKKYGDTQYFSSVATSVTGVLWVNDDTTANFGAQTVTLSERAANYDFLLIEYYYSTTGQQLQSQLISANYTGTIALRIVQAGANRTGGRNCTVSGTSVEFEAASFNGSTSNSNCIPYRITGIKL